MVQVWKIAPGKRAEDWELFREHKCVGLGWLVESDYREYDSEDEVLAALEEEYGKGVPGYGAGAAKMIWQFVHALRPHDIVVANEGYNRARGIGVVASDYLPPRAQKNPIRKDTTTHRHHVRRVDWLISERIYLPGKYFFVQPTIWQLDNEKFNRIRRAYATKYPHLTTTLDQVLIGYQAGISGLLTEEVADSPTLFEGAIRKISVNAYERNPIARQKCIAAHGTTCCICRFNFAEMYGPEAEGYIHVHHLRALSDADGEYIVDPIKDLRPVCPNCHAVLHLGGQCRSIEDVRKMVKRKKA